jgi:hypothetical protein
MFCHVPTFCTMSSFKKIVCFQLYMQWTYRKFNELSPPNVALQLPYDFWVDGCHLLRCKLVPSSGSGRKRFVLRDTTVSIVVRGLEVKQK